MHNLSIHITSKDLIKLVLDLLKEYGHSGLNANNMRVGFHITPWITSSLSYSIASSQESPESWAVSNGRRIIKDSEFLKEFARISETEKQYKALRKLHGNSN